MKKETLEIKRYLLNPFSSHFLLGKDSKSPCFTVNLHARSSLLIIVTGIFLLPLSGKQGPLLKNSLLSVYRPEKPTYKFFLHSGLSLSVAYSQKVCPFNQCSPETTSPKPETSKNG